MSEATHTHTIALSTHCVHLIFEICAAFWQLLVLSGYLCSTARPPWAPACFSTLPACLLSSHPPLPPLTLSSQVLLDEDDKERAADLAELLYETSLLTSGFALDQPKDYASKVYTLMKIALGYDLGEEPEQQPAPAAPSPAASSSDSSAAAAAGSSSSSPSSSGSSGPKVEAVEADVVVEGKGGDPWGKQ